MYCVRCGSSIELAPLV